MGTRPHIYVTAEGLGGVPRPDWPHPGTPDPNVSARNGGFTCEIRCYWPFGAAKEDILERLAQVHERAVAEIEKDFGPMS